MRYTVAIMPYTFYPLKLFVTKRPVYVAIGLAILINLIAWLWLYLGTTDRGQEVVLHYTTLFGVDQIGQFNQLYYIPLLGSGLILFNTLIAWILYPNNQFLGQLLLVATVWLQLGIVAAARILAFLNG